MNTPPMCNVTNVTFFVKREEIKGGVANRTPAPGLQVMNVNLCKMMKSDKYPVCQKTHCDNCHFSEKQQLKSGIQQPEDNIPTQQDSSTLK